MPVTTASRSVNRPTRRSGAALSVRTASVNGSARMSASPTQYASCKPTRPPATESSTLSTRCSRTSRPRPAPSARRTAVSFWRDDARVSSRLATLAHAISSTSPTMPMSTSSGVPDWSRRPEVPRPPGSSVSVFLKKRVLNVSDPPLMCAQSSCSSCAYATFTEACASACDTPSFSRAIEVSQRERQSPRRLPQVG